MSVDLHTETRRAVPVLSRHRAHRAAGALTWALGTAGFTALAVVLTWPWAREAWSGSVEEDAAQFVWDAWWVKERVFSLENPWWTGHLYAPEGAYLAANPNETLLMVLAAPLTALAGPMVTYGVLVIATIAAAGMLAWRLGLAMGVGRVGSIVTGVLWAASPTVVFKAWIGHYMLLLLAALLPAVLLLARRLAHSRRSRDGLWLGLLLGAALLTDLQVTAYLLLAVAAVAVYTLATKPAWRSRAALSPVATLVATFVLVGSPTLVMVARSELDGNYRTPKAVRVGWAAIANADLAQFALPSPASRFFGGTYENASERLGDLSTYFVDSAVSLGWAALALALVGALATRRSLRTWWLAGAVLVSLVLSLGPTFKLFGHTFVPLAVDAGRPVSAIAPGTWLLGIPVLNDLRIPARYALLGALPLALLAGLGAQVVVRRWRMAGTVVVTVLCGLAVSEGTVALRTNGPDAERLARIVADDPRRGVVVDVPLSWRSGIENVGFPAISPRAMVQQTVHGKPIAAGYIARLDRAMLDRLQVRPLYRSLLLRQGVGDIPPGVLDAAPAEATRDAERLGAHWIVVWPEADRRVLPYLEELGYRRRAQDGGVLLYVR